MPRRDSATSGWNDPRMAAPTTGPAAMPRKVSAPMTPRARGREPPVNRCDAAEVAYVGDRVDNDVLPAAAAGLVAIHVRRGPWGMLQPTPPEATVGIDDLASLTDALASLL